MFKSPESIRRAILVPIALTLSFFCVEINAQTSFENYKKEAADKFSKYKEQKAKEFEEYRRKVNEEFARYMELHWESADLKPVENAPVVPSPDPVVIDADTVKPKPPQPVIISEITPIPAPVPQPTPIEPVQEIPEERPVPQLLTVNLYGTDFSVRKPALSDLRLSGVTGSDISKAWKWLNTDRTNNLINDCLKLREEKALCDWAYLNLLHTLAAEITGGKKNETTLLTGFLFSQSGYKMRFGMDSKHQLHLLYNPTGIVFNTPLTLIEGARFYKFDNGIPLPKQFEICNFKFPGERPLNFEISESMKLDYEPAPVRKVTAHNHPEVQVEVAVNKNLIDFYNTYPEASLTEKNTTLWATYGNVPATPEITEGLYPALRKAVAGKSQKDAANILLHLAQSFKYGYDDEIWGRDRAFFMDESWHYPLSDCEDHAINFSRMVRDILGLSVVLVLYPDHLATAVAFTDPEIKGDYIIYNNQKYIVCDPTIFYSNIGMTMRGMNNEEAVLIPLR